jgi:hypothetical protein
MAVCDASRGLASVRCPSVGLRFEPVVFDPGVGQALLLGGFVLRGDPLDAKVGGALGDLLRCRECRYARARAFAMSLIEHKTRFYSTRARVSTNRTKSTSRRSFAAPQQFCRGLHGLYRQTGQITLPQVFVVTPSTLPRGSCVPPRLGADARIGRPRGG